MRLAVLVLVLASALADDVFMPPTSQTGQHVALIWAQGALAPPELYKPLFSVIQRLASVPVWIAAPQTPLNLPNPATLGPALDRARAKLSQMGMPNDTVLVYGGHSLGSVFIQDYATSASSNASAVVMTGGFIARKSLVPTLTFPLPALTIGGELDGLARVTRSVVESYYHLIANNPDPTASRRFPVTMVQGMNHWQIASGPASSFVQYQDLIPEISDDEAHNATGALIADFVSALVGAGKGDLVAQAVKEAGVFSKPLLTAYMREGSRHFNAPAQVGGPLESTCSKGLCADSSEWATVAQGVIASSEGFSLDISNRYVQMSATPITGGEFHLPEIHADLDTKTVTITTYAQGQWDTLDRFDTGASPVSASEIQAKLASRQCVLTNITGQNISFSVDSPDFCAQANRLAYEWALRLSSPRTLTRFSAFGQRMQFAPDIDKQGGPFWINAHLQYNEVTVNGTAVLEIAAPMQKTEKDYWEKHFPFPRPSFIPDPGCFHYCKLLSPARAMEWIYVDGLRASRSNISQCTTCVGANNTFCWVDGQCYSPGDNASPCSQPQCVSVAGGCDCDSCSDPDCAYLSSALPSTRLDAQEVADVPASGSGPLLQRQRRLESALSPNNV